MDKFIEELKNRGIDVEGLSEEEIEELYERLLDEQETDLFFLHQQGLY